MNILSLSLLLLLLSSIKSKLSNFVYFSFIVSFAFSCYSIKAFLLENYSQCFLTMENELLNNAFELRICLAFSKSNLTLRISIIFLFLTFSPTVFSSLPCTGCIVADKFLRNNPLSSWL